MIFFKSGICFDEQEGIRCGCCNSPVLNGVQCVLIVPSQSPCVHQTTNSPYLPLKHIFFSGVFICIIHTEMNYWITWKCVCQIIKDGCGDLVSWQHVTSCSARFKQSFITTVDSSSALKRVQMWIVSVSLLAACWGVLDRWETVWFVLVGKKKQKYQGDVRCLSHLYTAVHGKKKKKRSTVPR